MLICWRCLLSGLSRESHLAAAVRYLCFILVVFLTDFEIGGCVYGSRDLINLIYFKMSPSKKRPSSSGDANARQGTQSVLRRRVHQGQEGDVFEKTVSEAGCGLSPNGPILLSRELQQRLELRLTRDASIVGPFLAGFQSHIEKGENLHRLAMFIFCILQFCKQVSV